MVERATRILSDLEGWIRWEFYVMLLQVRMVGP